jgi:peptidoglycan/LPS O-acetylase OafA/YrhL
MTTAAEQSARGSPHDSANLDFLRAVAVLLVFFVHLYDISGGHGKKWSIEWRLGELGVLIFFVHTCLVLMWSLDRSGFSGWRLPVSFYIRRIFRLYPLSIVCVLVAYCIDLSWNPPNLWQNLTLTQNLFPSGKYEVPPLFTPLWTLPLEVQMYVALPALFVIFRNRSLKLLVGTWCLFVVAALAQPKLGGRFEILKYLPCFTGGVVAWRLMRTGTTRQLAGWLWPPAILVASILWLTVTEKFAWLHIAVFGLCLGLCVPYFKEIPWPRVRQAAKIVARYSYSIYLSHFAIQLFVFSGGNRFKLIHPLPSPAHFVRPLHWVMVAVLSTVIPFLLYHFIESPGIQLGHKLARLATNAGKRPALQLQTE